MNYRKGDIYWHDYNYLVNCVRETGATPWVWGDSAIADFENFKKNVHVQDDIVLNPWWYHAWNPEHYTRLDSQPHWEIHIKNHPDLQYFEQLHPETMEGYRQLAREGYKLVPCGSYYELNQWCFDDTIEEYNRLCKKENLLGFMTAPWAHTIVENTPIHRRDFEQLRLAREKHYPKI